ncbi:glycoside hydrolase family 81 protein [Atractiella rhizophila]|nr:glycoside hydrolase family 81 protein [Atractiella rhizophila]
MSLWSIALSLLPAANAVFGPISTSAPNVAGGTQANDQPPTSFYQGFKPPFPTSGDCVAAGPFPYQSRLLADSIHFGVGNNRDFDGVSIHQPTQDDWAAGFTELNAIAANHKALAWDTQTVTLQYFTGSSTMTSYMVPGSPYITLNYAGATPKLTSQNGAITSFNGQAVSNSGAAVTASGTKFKVVNSAGTYIIYSLGGSITLSATSTTITGSAKVSGVIRIAKLQAAGHEATLDQYYQNYATAVTTDYSFSGDSATLTFSWAVTGNANQLLHLTWPHHRVSLQGASILPSSSISYLTTKGYMLGTVGSTWRLNYNLPTITWNAPRSPHSSCINLVRQSLIYEANALLATTPPVPGDFYGWGGTIAAKARLALIADHIGEGNLRDRLVTWLETAFAPWFNAASATKACYESNYGGIINCAGWNNMWVDYGNSYYNDHHFHYGYFLSIAAVIGHFDPAWRDAHKETITHFLRDYVNPSKNDPYYTPTRMRDWFAGHSWASGMYNGAGSRDQESVGEAVNGYYGAMLWAEVIGNNDIKNYARLLLANEIQAAQIYWHLYPAADGNARDQPYPEQAFRNLITVGNVEDWQSGAWLFWGDQRVEIAAIQILPVTPVNELMYDATWVRNVISYTSGELGNASYGDEWKSVIYAAYSNADPADAFTRSQTLTTWGSGNTATNEVYFISTRPNPPSTVCSASAANPVGNFKLSHNNNFVRSPADRVDLYTDGTSSTATTYTFNFVPGGGTIKATSNNQFVTADQSGNFPLGAARAVASAWETFIVRPKTGAGSNVYTIKAGSNKKYVVVQADGSLRNTGDTEASGTGFLFTAA